MSDRIVHISLETFLRTGSLGPIEVGMSRAHVHQILGEPEAVGTTTRRYRAPRLWAYGDVELYFDDDDGRLTSIYLDNFDIPQGAKRLHLDPWLLRGTMLLGEAEDVLHNAGITYSHRPWPTYSETTHMLLVTAAGVTLGFILVSESYDPPAGLHHIARG